MPAAAALPATASAAAIPEFGRKAGETAAAAGAAAAREGEEVSEPTRDTIKALEQARQKIEQAFEPKPERRRTAKQPPLRRSGAGGNEVTEDEPEAVASRANSMWSRSASSACARRASCRTARSRPKRSEGWMRFENLEHLDEYLDAMEPAKG